MSDYIVCLYIIHVGNYVLHVTEFSLKFLYMYIVNFVVFLFVLNFILSVKD